MTPESRVKAAIKKVLDAYKPNVYYHMPVQRGMGMPTLDFVGTCCGSYFTIEAKAPGAAPTPIQVQTMATVERAGGAVFLIDDIEGPAMAELEEWVHRHVMRHVGNGVRW